MLPNSPTTLVTDDDYAQFMRDNPVTKEEMYRELDLNADEIAQIEALIAEDHEADTTTSMTDQGAADINGVADHG